ncbi:MAG: GIY-YIG nuclease family protein [Ignisphaera sp.]
MPTKGIYTLILEIEEDICTNIGSLGRICLLKGVYGYVGSAKGLGGIEARVKHHLIKDKKKHWWHIDYLTSRKEVAIKCVVYAKTLDIGEEDIVGYFSRSSCWSIAVPRFGSTDKNSSSHLFKCNCNISSCIEDLENIFMLLGLEPNIMDISGV